MGLLITSINLIPIGQLDGGHILYGMFREKAHVASIVVLVLAISASIALRLTNWWLMLGLIAFLGTRHPPTADDSVPLGAGRYVLGILTLAFLVLGFTSVPMQRVGALISQRLHRRGWVACLHAAVRDLGEARKSPTGRRP